MFLKVKDIDIATGGVLVAILHEDDANALGIHSGDRILLKKKRKELVVLVDVAESNKSLKAGKIGLFEEVLDKLHLVHGDKIRVRLAEKPGSLKHIRDKLYGKKLGYKEFYHLMNDIVHDRLSDIEKTYFVSAGFSRGFTLGETVAMTKAMVDTGEVLHLRGNVLDKHCIGGIPGNRTTPIVVSIVSAAGYKFPKTSSRAITSPAGTADTMEVLCKVDLSAKQLEKQVKKISGALVWGGAMNLAPADDKIIRVERPLSVDAEGQMLASVMAKKKSVGATHLLIDIPKGWSAKVKKNSDADRIKKAFLSIGRKLGICMKVVVTDGNQPIGNGVGPLLEAIDVMRVLHNKDDAPKDLRRKSLQHLHVIWPQVLRLSLYLYLLLSKT